MYEFTQNQKLQTAVLQSNTIITSIRLSIRTTKIWICMSLDLFL